MTKFKELPFPEPPSAEVEGEIKSVSQNRPLKAVISIYDLLSAAQVSKRLTAPGIPGEPKPLTKPTRADTKCLGYPGFGSKVSLVSTFIIKEDPGLSHSLYKLALQAINEREQSVLKSCPTEEILQEGKNDQMRKFSTGDLPTIEHLAFHPTAPLLALSTSLSTIHLYDLGDEAFTTNFFSPAPIKEKGEYPKIMALEFSPAGLLAVGLSNGIVDIWTIGQTRPKRGEVSSCGRYSLFVLPHSSPERAARNTGCSLPIQKCAPFLKDTSALYSSSKEISLYGPRPENTSRTVPPTQVGAGKAGLKKLATCKSISLIGQSPYLAQAFRPREILGTITSLSFSPSGTHLAIGTEKAGLWHYNTILHSVTNILSGPLNVKCLSWGPAFSSVTPHSIFGKAGYKPPPDVTHLVAGLAGGGAAYFKVRECGIALRFTGGSITFRVPISYGQVGIESRNDFLPDIHHVLVASPFCGIYGEDSFGPLHNEPDPLILLSRQDTGEVQVFHVSPSTTQPPTLKSFRNIRGYDGMQNIWTYIWTIICHNFYVHFYLLFNKISTIMEIPFVNDCTGFEAECIACVDVSYVNRSGVSLTSLTHLTPSTASEFAEPTQRQPHPNQDTVSGPSSLAMDTPRTSSESTGSNTDAPLPQTEKLQTQKTRGIFLQKGYGGKVASMAMDREGRRLVVRFEHEGEISSVLFDTRGAYHLSRLEHPHQTNPDQQEISDGQEDNMRHKNGPALLYDLGEKLLRPLAALVPQTPIAESMTTVGPVKEKSVLVALREFGSSQMKEHLKGTLMEPYIDDLLGKMHQEEDDNNARAKQGGNQGKGKEKEQTAEEELGNNELYTAAGTAQPREASRNYTRIGDVEIIEWKDGGIVGMILGKDKDVSGGNRVAMG